MNDFIKAAEIKQRLVFLDIDGPLCNARAVLSSGTIGVTRYIDPIAVGFLNQLYIAAPYRIVVTSTWRNEVYMPILLASCGVLAPCHVDWSTSNDQVSGSNTSMDDRPFQVNQWLDDHKLLTTNSQKEDLNINPFEPVVDLGCLIIDDDSFNWHPWQKECWIKADSYDGIPLMQMQRAFDLFQAEWPAKNRTYPT